MTASINAQDNLNKLPESCFVFIESNSPGHYIGMVKRGERGYYPTSYDVEDKEHAKLTVDFMNEKLEVTKVQAECMYNGSLFGWDTPGANVDYVQQMK
jgi:hypothetical protein